MEVDGDERLGDEAGHAICDRHGVDIVRHCCGGVEGKTSVKYPKVTQRTRLRFGQQFIAPIKRRKQSLLPR